MPPHAKRYVHRLIGNPRRWEACARRPRQCDRGVCSITMQHQVKVRQKELEVKSQQVQKSESLGRMAGAIAHHFNNQLQVVMLNLQHQS